MNLNNFINNKKKSNYINTSLIVKEVSSKSILSNSKIYKYVINPYVGCEHSCAYCYACYMKKFTNHDEKWGSFVDVKINAPLLLEKEIRNKKKDKVWLSSVCDCYQPIEEKYELTRNCIKVLVRNNWPIVIQTRSDLVIRDIDILKKSCDVEVAFSTPTIDDNIRKLFEPNAPSINRRLNAIKKLKKEDIKTSIMIAPILPKAEKIIEEIKDLVDFVIVDKLNYNYADYIYKKNNLEKYKTEEYFKLVANKIKDDCKKFDIECKIVF